MLEVHNHFPLSPTNTHRRARGQASPGSWSLCFHTHLSVLSVPRVKAFLSQLAYPPHLSALHVASASLPQHRGRAFSSAALPGTALCIFPPHQLFISLQTESRRLSLLPAALSFSFVISFMSGDVNVFTRQCLHTAVSCNYSPFPPTVPAHLTVKYLEEGQCGEKTQNRLRSSSVMLTFKRVKPIITSAVAH